jgi:hypothetical protein
MKTDFAKTLSNHGWTSYRSGGMFSGHKLPNTIPGSLSFTPVNGHHKARPVPQALLKRGGYKRYKRRR